jgi:RNA polymerase sigma factor (sigma-70 family)
MSLTPQQRKLVESAMPMVEVIARRMHRRFPEIPVDDFVSAGNAALVEAARGHDPSGAPFEAYALKRIRGAMLRATSETFGSLHINLQKALSRGDGLDPPPADLDLEAALEDTPGKARDRAAAWMRRQFAGMFISALSPQSGGGEEELVARESYKECHAALERGLAELTSDESYFIDRYYRQNATLEQIATELNCVKRTVQRMHDGIRERLHKRLRKGGVTEEPHVVDVP